MKRLSVDDIQVRAKLSPTIGFAYTGPRRLRGVLIRKIDKQGRVHHLN